VAYGISRGRSCAALCQEGLNGLRAMA